LDSVLLFRFQRAWNHSPMSWSVILVFPLFALAFVAGVRASCNGELRKRPVRRRLTALSGVRDRANRRLRTHLCVSGFSPRQVFCFSGSSFCWCGPQQGPVCSAFAGAQGCATGWFAGSIKPPTDLCFSDSLASSRNRIGQSRIENVMY
jgi:hypothetical protein